MDFLPKPNELIISLIVALISAILFWLWNKFKALPKVNVPGWLLGAIVIYILMSGYFTITNVFERKTLTKVSREVYGTEKVVLDGKSFTDCTFNRTELIIRGEKPFTLGYCKFNDVKFTFEANAALTLEIIRKMKDDPSFEPLLNRIYNDLGKK